jgi:hypothetical protein
MQSIPSAIFKSPAETHVLARGPISTPEPKSISVSTRPQAMPFDLFVETAQPFNILSAASNLAPSQRTPEHSIIKNFLPTPPVDSAPKTYGSPTVPRLPSIGVSRPSDSPHLMPIDRFKNTSSELASPRERPVELPTAPPSLASPPRKPKDGPNHSSSLSSPPLKPQDPFKKSTETRHLPSLLDNGTSVFLMGAAEPPSSSSKATPTTKGTRTLPAVDNSCPPAKPGGFLPRVSPDDSFKGPISSLSRHGSQASLNEGGSFRLSVGDDEKITCPFQAVQKMMQMKGESSPLFGVHPLVAGKSDSESISSHTLMRQNSDDFPQLSRVGSNHGRGRRSSAHSIQSSRSGSGTILSGLTGGLTHRETSTNGGSGTRRTGGKKSKFGGGVFRGKTNKKKLTALSKSNTPPFDEALCRKHAPLVKESWMLAMSKRSFSELGLLYYDTLFEECPVRNTRLQVPCDMAHFILFPSRNIYKYVYI